MKIFSLTIQIEMHKLLPDISSSLQRLNGNLWSRRTIDAKVKRPIHHQATCIERSVPGVVVVAVHLVKVVPCIRLDILVQDGDEKIPVWS